MPVYFTPAEPKKVKLLTSKNKVALDQAKSGVEDLADALSGYIELTKEFEKLPPASEDKKEKEARLKEKEEKAKAAKEKEAKEAKAAKEAKGAKKGKAAASTAKEATEAMEAMKETMVEAAVEMEEKEAKKGRFSRKPMDPVKAFEAKLKEKLSKNKYFKNTLGITLERLFFKYKREPKLKKLKEAERATVEARVKQIDDRIQKAAETSVDDLNKLLLEEEELKPGDDANNLGNGDTIKSMLKEIINKKQVWDKNKHKSGEKKGQVKGWTETKVVFKSEIFSGGARGLGSNVRCLLLLLRARYVCCCARATCVACAVRRC